MREKLKKPGESAGEGSSIQEKRGDKEEISLLAQDRCQESQNKRQSP